MDMAKLQKRINNPQLESAEFQLSMPHYQDTLTLWSSEFDSIRNEFNTTSFAEYTSSILELEYRLENITPRWHPEVARILLYHYEITELWYLKDKRSLKYVTDQLPSWPTLINNDRLMQAVFS